MGSGIYAIKNVLNGRVYIGSSINIKQRKQKHYALLRHNKHTNSHLQNAWNKYGEKVFRLTVIEKCDNLSEREQFYIDKNKKLYNMVTLDVTRITLEPEVKTKIKGIIDKMYASGKLSRFNSGSFIKGTKPWNTNKTYESTDHLKVPKKKKGCRESFKTNMRNQMPEVLVFDINNQFLGKWNSSKDLQEDSKNSNFKLIPFMILRFPTGKIKTNPFILQSINVNRSDKLGIPYKGLYFKLKQKQFKN